VGVNIFDPDDDSLPDFCRDVLGRETSRAKVAQKSLSMGNSLLLLAYGLFVGFLIGFWLGTLAQTALQAGG
jgi:hypothetical protein